MGESQEEEEVLWMLPLPRLVIENTHSKFLNQLLELPDGTLLSCCGSTFDPADHIKRWTVTNDGEDGSVKHRLISSLPLHKFGVKSLALWNEDLVLSGSIDKTVKLWNYKTKDCVRVIEDEHYNSEVFSITKLRNQLNHDEGDLIVGYYRGHIERWDVMNQRCVKVFDNKHSEAVVELLELTNGTLVSSSFDCEVKAWDVGRGACLRTLNSTEANFVRSIVELTERRDLNNNIIIACASQSSITFWDVIEGVCLRSFRTWDYLHSNSTLIMAITEISTGIAVSGCRDGSFMV